MFASAQQQHDARCFHCACVCVCSMTRVRFRQRAWTNSVCASCVLCVCMRRAPQANELEWEKNRENSVENRLKGWVLAFFVSSERRKNDKILLFVLEEARPQANYFEQENFLLALYVCNHHLTLTVSLFFSIFPPNLVQFATNAQHFRCSIEQCEQSTTNLIACLQSIVCYRRRMKSLLLGSRKKTANFNNISTLCLFR